LSFLAALPVIGSVVEKILGVVDQAVEDKDAANKLKAEIQTKMLGLDYSALEKELDVRAQILTAEITSQSWLARNWRPILMLVIVAIVANNYLIFPYVKLFGGESTILELPERLWTLMEIGVGGYIIGRSGEKIAGTFKK
jgi:hypothetical protein